MLAIVAVAVLGAWIGFANPVAQFPVAILAFPLGLCWIAFRSTSSAKAFRYGWVAGSLACLGVFYWMAVPVAIYSALPKAVAIFCPPLAGALMGLCYGIFSWSLYHYAHRMKGYSIILFASLLWCSMEIAQSVLFTGFPWMNIAAALAPWPLLIQGASVVGSFGLSGFITAVVCSALLFNTLRRATLITFLLTFVTIGWGWYQLNLLPLAEPDFPVAIAQGSVEQSSKWDPAYQDSTVETYLKLSQAAIDDGAQLVIWPETATPFYLQDPTDHANRIKQFARDNRTQFIIGTPAYRITDAQKGEYVLLNRASYLDSFGIAVDAYDKEHLVPFGEYMPFEEYVPFEKLVEAAGNFVPGELNRPLKAIAKIDGTMTPVAVGMLICYEAIFPELAQKQVTHGAQVLAIISNDAWFGKTSAPRQHLGLNTMRAVEQRRWIIRCTNNGISVFIDPVGRIVAGIDQFAVAQATWKVSSETGKTIYHHIQPLIDEVVFGLVGFLVCLCIFFGKREENKRVIQ